MFTSTSPRLAWGSCDVLPAVSPTFAARLGTTSPPYATPGDTVEIALRSCDPTTPPLTTEAGFSAPATSYKVAVVFTPVAGPRHAVVLTAAQDCSSVGVIPCSSADAETAACCVAGLAAGMTTGTTVSGPGRLRFAFPDTDALVGDPNDRRTLAGPALIAVMAASATQDPVTISSCADGGFLACIDALYRDDECSTDVPAPIFGQFTALPPANDYSALCVDPNPPCTGLADEVRFAVDADGNVLLPMDWQGVQLHKNELPVPRQLRATTTLDAFAGVNQAIRFPPASGSSVPDPAFLGSYARDGRKLPPVFDMQRAATDDADVTAFFGTVDAPFTVLRIARRSPEALVCRGGDDAGRPCRSSAACVGGTCGIRTCVDGENATRSCIDDIDCPGGTCRDGLFDFADRVLDGVGPVVVRDGACVSASPPTDMCTADDECPGSECGDLFAAALDPVSLDGLIQSRDANVFVVAESIDDRQLNRDGDVVDDVVVVSDRASGDTRSLGVPGECPVVPNPNPSPGARAIMRIRQPPFSFPAVAVENDLIAFLESEPGEGDCDTNGNGSVFDPILRIFRLGDGTLDPIATNALRTADAAPLVEGASLAISAGRIFVRRPEAATAAQVTTQVSVNSANVGGNSFSYRPAISANGRYVAFESSATNLDLAQSDPNDPPFVYVRDLVARTTERVSSAAGTPSISSDGRFVAYASSGTATATVFVRDRCVSNGSVVPGCVATTELVGGAALIQNGTVLQISANGRFVTYVAGNARADVFVYDRLTHATERVSVAANGNDGDADSGIFGATLSGDGNVAVFASEATNLVSGATTSGLQIFARDRARGVTELVSRSGLAAGNNSSFYPSISVDGRYVVFNSYSSNLALGAVTNPAGVFLRDRVAGTTQYVVADSTGRPAFGGGIGVVSNGGRFVAFGSDDDRLVAGDSNGVSDVFVRDLRDGATARASVSSSSAQSLNNSPFFAGGFIAISADGRRVAFDSFAENFGTGPGNGTLDVFVRGPDNLDASADLTEDGDADDTVLEVVDGETGTTVGPSCPAEQVAIADGVAAFLRPESAGPATGCPSDAPSLNGDGDQDDLVVHLKRTDGTVENLGRSATQVALSDRVVAALVPDDDGDTMVEVHPVASGAGSWKSLGVAGDTVGVIGDVVVFITPDEGAGRRLFVYLDDIDELIDVGERADEFVLGGFERNELIAFRTPQNDYHVLKVFDVARHRAGENGVLPTGQAVTPCPFEACSPRVPYRVGRDTVVFLTFEGDQDIELVDPETPNQLVLQTFNARLAALNTSLLKTGRRARLPQVDPTASTALGAISTGVCTTTAKACTRDAECDSGVCFVPPGGCVRNLGTPCTLPFLVDPCGEGNFCQPTAGQPGQGSCQTLVRMDDGQPIPCTTAANCPATATCNTAGQVVQRLVGPLAAPGGGGEVVTSAGRCTEHLSVPCTSDLDCAATTLCGNDVPRTCVRKLGTCRNAADCPNDLTCEAELTIATDADGDGDEIIDRLDNCPAVFNPNQANRDSDTAGDVCDCGDGLVAPVSPGVPGEECDDGNAAAGDGCDPTCRVEACSTCTGTPSQCTKNKACTLCERALAAAGAQLVVARARVLGGCEIAKIGGRLPSSHVCAADPEVQSALARADGKLASKIATACGGRDKRCGTGPADETSPRAVQFPLQCPFADSCSGTISHCGDVAQCLACGHAAFVGAVVDATFGKLTPTNPKDPAQKKRNRCQQVLGKSTIKFVGVQARILQQCWDARLRGKHHDACPNANTTLLLAKAAAVRDVAVCKACGGADQRCGGSDDITPAEIGLTGECPNDAVPALGICANAIKALPDVVSCLGCVTRAAGFCLDRTQVPQLVAVPSTCEAQR